MVFCIFYKSKKETFTPIKVVVDGTKEPNEIIISKNAEKVKRMYPQYNFATG